MTSPLRPVQLFFPDQTPRWIADTCRAGKLPGAVKVGKVWMIRESDIERLTKSKAEKQAEERRIPTVEEAMADLRRRGVV